MNNTGKEKRFFFDNDSAENTPPPAPPPPPPPPLPGAVSSTMFPPPPQDQHRQEPEQQQHSLSATQQTIQGQHDNQFNGTGGSGGGGGGGGGGPTTADVFKFCHLAQTLELCNYKAKDNTERRRWIEQLFSNIFRVRSNLGRGEVGSDFYPFLRLLAPDLDKSVRVYGVHESKLIDLYISLHGLDRRTSEPARRLANWRSPAATGPARPIIDVGEAVYFFLTDRGTPVLGPRCENASDYTVGDVDRTLNQLWQSRVAEAKSILSDFMHNMSATEQRWLVRIIVRHMKQHVSGYTILQWLFPLAKERYLQTNDLLGICRDCMSESQIMTQISKEYVDKERERMMTSAQRALGGEADAVAAAANVAATIAEQNSKFIEVGKPFTPMLADSVSRDKIEKALNAAALSNVAVVAEPKFDGERLLLHVQKKPTLQLDYFTRRCRIYTQMYRHLDEMLISRISCENSCIIDGEMIVYDSKRNCFLPFGTLKHLQSGRGASKMEDVGIWTCFNAFDIVQLNGESLAKRPLGERKQILKQIVQPLPTRLEIVSGRQVRSWRDVVLALDETVRAGHEGLVIKPFSSPYILADRSLWLKCKMDLIEGLVDTVDAVVLGGFHGNKFGRNDVTHFLIGVWVGGVEQEGADGLFGGRCGGVALAVGAAAAASSVAAAASSFAIGGGGGVGGGMNSDGSSSIPSRTSSSNDSSIIPRQGSNKLRMKQCKNVHYNPGTNGAAAAAAAAEEEDGGGGGGGIKKMFRIFDRNTRHVYELPVSESPVSPDAQFTPLTKVGSGYTHQELQDMCRMLEPAKYDWPTGAKDMPPWFGGWQPSSDFRPDVFYDPTRSQVVEILGYSFESSTKVPIGLNVRFPRFRRWRQDKRVEDATTLAQLIRIIEASGGGIKPDVDPDSLSIINRDAKKELRAKAAAGAAGWSGSGGGKKGARGGGGGGGGAALRRGEMLGVVDEEHRREKVLGIFAGFEVNVMHFVGERLFAAASGGASSAGGLVAAAPTTVKLEPDLASLSTPAGGADFQNNNNHDDEMRTRMRDLRNAVRTKRDLETVLSNNGARISANSRAESTDIHLAHGESQQVKNFVSAVRANPALDSGYTMFDSRTHNEETRQRYSGPGRQAKKSVDIVSVKWALRCIAAGKLEEPRPEETFFAGRGLQRLMHETYDEFGDSYFEAATAQSLHASMGRALKKLSVDHERAKEERRQVSAAVAARRQRQDDDTDCGRKEKTNTIHPRGQNDDDDDDGEDEDVLMLKPSVDYDLIGFIGQDAENAVGCLLERYTELKQAFDDDE